MLRKFLSMVLIGASLGAVGCGSASEEIEKKEDKKIVSGSVAVTGVFDALDMNLVGVPTTKSTLPEKYTGVQDIGQAFAPNFETVISLSPDLVVFDSSFKDKLDEQVKQYNLEAFYFDTTTFTNFKNSIKEIGEIVEREEKAENLIESLQNSVDEVLEKGKEKKDIRVAVVFGTAESYMLATDFSYVGDLLNSIEVENITDEIKDINSDYLNFSMEQVVKENPDYILRLSHGDLEATKKAFDKEFSENPAWSSLEAVKEGKVYDLDPSIFGVSANLRVTEAIKELGNIIYGE